MLLHHTCHESECCDTSQHLRFPSLRKLRPTQKLEWLDGNTPVGFDLRPTFVVEVVCHLISSAFGQGLEVALHL